jgi:hypothetical protein
VFVNARLPSPADDKTTRQEISGPGGRVTDAQFDFRRYRIQFNRTQRERMRASRLRERAAARESFHHSRGIIVDDRFDRYNLRR